MSADTLLRALMAAPWLAGDFLVIGGLVLTVQLSRPVCVGARPSLRPGLVLGAIGMVFSCVTLTLVVVGVPA